MRPVAVIVILTGVLAVLCAMLMARESAAEPISGAESLADPWRTTSQEEVASKAQARFDAKDFDGALRLYKEIAKNNADLPPAQVMMAELYLRAGGMLGEARQALRRAVVDAPGDPEAYLVMAVIAMSERDIAKAEALYAKAHALMSAFNKSAKRKDVLQPQIFSGLAGVAQARGDWAGAQKTIEEWLKRDPKNVGAVQRLAYCLFQQKNAEGALERLRQAAKADAKLLTPEALLAQFYQQSGDRKNAGKWMAAALAAAPKDLNTRLAASRWALETGQFDEAQKQAIAALQIDPKSLDAEMLSGMIALCRKDYRTAESYLESALARSPKRFLANNLALALIGQNDEPKKRRALELAEGNVKQFPESPEAASTYGLVLYRLGRLDDAENALRAAASIAASDVDTAYVIARVSVDRGRKAEARQLLENALRSTTLCMFRQEAEELLGQLKK